MSKEVYGEDRPLEEEEWLELIFRMEDLFREFSRTVIEGGEEWRQTNRRIADTAFEMARRRMLEDLEQWKG